jgi:hypothetical protein
MIRTGSSEGGVPVRSIVVGVLALVASIVAARRVEAQAISLRISPPVGETLRMRLDQRIEMTGTTRMPAGDTTATMVATLLVISRAFVERRDRDATIVLASTDSVVASSTGPDSWMISAEALRALQGRRVRLRIAPDGATEVLGGASGAELNAVFSQMPATLPSAPIPVGQSWSRVMMAPLAGTPAIGGEGKLQVRFTLDSLSANGESAHVSLHGTLDGPGSAKDGYGVLTMSGTMTGGLVIDRRRGWITEARMTYMVRSVMTPPAGSNAASLRFRMKVTQWMRAER